MTKKQKELAARVDGYLTKWMPRMHLDNWLVVLKVLDMPGSITIAQIDWTPNYKTAYMVVNSKVENADIELTDTMLEHRVVHELCHLLTAPIGDVLRRELSEDGHTYSDFMDATESVTEHLVWIVEKRFASTS